MATQKTTAAKTATVTAGTSESEASKASRNAPIDLSALSVTKAAPDALKVAAGAGRPKADNSVAEGWVRDSWDSRKDGDKMGEGRALTVPTAAAGTVQSRLRAAARTLGLGLAVKVIDGDSGTSTVNFAAKTPKNTKAKTA